MKKLKSYKQFSKYESILRGDSLLRTVMELKMKERKQEEDIDRRCWIEWWQTDIWKDEGGSTTRWVATSYVRACL